MHTHLVHIKQNPFACLPLLSTLHCCPCRVAIAACCPCLLHIKGKGAFMCTSACINCNFNSKRNTIMESDHAAAQETYDFGPYKIKKKEVFFTTDLSFAFVNLRPVVPGHVLVCPKRLVKRFADLTAEETTDLWLSAQKIGSKLESHLKASSLTLAIQDGPEAGQTVPHVHIHILPRKGGDFEKNDEIYDVIDVKEKELKEKLDLDKERKDRTTDEMVEEADEFRALFEL